MTKKIQKSRYQLMAEKYFPTKQVKLFSNQQLKSARGLTKYELLTEMDKYRNELLYKQIDIQELGAQYQELIKLEGSLKNWPKTEQKTYKTKLLQLENMLGLLFKIQKKDSITIEMYHKQIEKNLGHNIDISSNNVYGIIKLAIELIKKE